MLCLCICTSVVTCIGNSTIRLMMGVVNSDKACLRTRNFRSVSFVTLSSSEVRVVLATSPSLRWRHQGTAFEGPASKHGAQFSIVKALIAKIQCAGVWRGNGAPALS